MTHIDPEGMAAATRLTREGRLTKATALIQRLLHGTTSAPPEASEPWHGPTIDLVPDAEPASEPPAREQRRPGHSGPGQ